MKVSTKNRKDHRFGMTGLMKIESQSKRAITTSSEWNSALLRVISMFGFI